MNKLICKYILQHYKYISFDVFDTLIERDVNKPSDIFTLVGGSILGEERAEEFHKFRKKAEREVREEKQYMEITLDQIYDKLGEIYERDIIEKLKNEEIKMEIEHCHIKMEMTTLYKACIKKEKHILIISDMYLPVEVIQRMLKHCNVMNYESLYVSNECGANKISGELFKIVMHQEGIKQSEMIHIGDSVKADFLGPRKAGIKSVLISRKKRLERLIHS